MRPLTCNVFEMKLDADCGPPFHPRMPHPCFRAIRHLCLFALAASVCSAADLSQAVVRQKVNIVTVAPNVGAQAHPAAQGSVVRDENIVRTGSESRAELEFTDLTLARMGSNSIFSFDAQARALSFTQGAVLFSKPTRSGAIELRSGAITAAITGSTGFISNVPIGGVRTVRHAPVHSGDSTTMVGMLEGKLTGDAHWQDKNGREQKMNFRLGAGDMLIAQPGRRPVIVQFDIPRFLETSPLVKGFSRPLPNTVELNRAVVAYQEDARRGFIQATNVSVSSHIAWTGYTSPTRGAFDASVAALGQQSSSGTNPSGGDGGFIPVGGTGVIRGQLVWDTHADLDLYLMIPGQQVPVYYGNPSVTFNGGKATAVLDHDNRGGIIDAPPAHRVENIAVNGMISNGTYTFFVNSFATPDPSDPFTLRVFYNGRTQVLNGTLAPNQTSSNVAVHVGGG
jgi:FecR protein